MLHLILVRHGETEWNVQRRYQGQTDTTLSAFGRRQAEWLAGWLAKQKIDIVYASDLKRAWETASVIAEKINVNVLSEPRLREMRFGIIEGLTFDEAQAQYPEMMAAWLEDYNKPPTGGETLDEFTEYVESLFTDLQRKHNDETVLLVGHSGPLKELLRFALGLLSQGQWYFELDTASVSELLVYADQVVLKRLNDTCCRCGAPAIWPWCRRRFPCRRLSPPGRQC